VADAHAGRNGGEVAEGGLAPLEEGVALAVAGELKGGVEVVGVGVAEFVDLDGVVDTWTEWSMTSSAGWSGLIFSGSPPRVFMASRMAARSTTAGTPVKSCMSTRAGMKAISREGSALGSQLARKRMSSAVTESPSSWRRRFSSRMRRE
jgi:hypothetical protein